MGKPTNEARIKRLEERADAADEAFKAITKSAKDIQAILAWIKETTRAQSGRNRG